MSQLNGSPFTVNTVFVVVFFGFMIIFGSDGLSTKSGVHANPTCERGNLTVIAAKTCEKRWWCRMNCVEAKEQSVNLRGGCGCGAVSECRSAVAEEIVVSVKLDEIYTMI